MQGGAGLLTCPSGRVLCMAGGGIVRDRLVGGVAGDRSHCPWGATASHPQARHPAGCCGQRSVRGVLGALPQSAARGSLLLGRSRMLHCAPLRVWSQPARGGWHTDGQRQRRKQHDQKLGRDSIASARVVAAQEDRKLAAAVPRVCSVTRRLRTSVWRVCSDRAGEALSRHSSYEWLTPCDTVHIHTC